MPKLNAILLPLIVFGVIVFVALAAIFSIRWQTAPPPIGHQEVAFNPPRLEDAPADLRDAVLLGYNIMRSTREYAPAYAGNGLSCTNCHFQAGIAKDGIPLVGVAAVYPKYRERTRYATDLVARTNECFERSMNGKAAPVDSREMQALQAYYAWISRGVPIYSKVPWLGVRTIQSDHRPNADAGRTVFSARCSPCHGADGQGTEKAPAVWGPLSFNDGAGMDKLDTLAGFVFANMPRGSPSLSVDQALDVAAFVRSQPRPHFDPGQPEK